QNVASFFAKRLSLDWRVGAEWYELLLIDYDLSNNWGNWQYNSGVGNDPRGGARIFNPVKQAHDYDTNGEYVKTWVQELRVLSDSQQIFQAWMVPKSERKALGLNDIDWIERPLKRIDFYLDGKGKGPRGGGGWRG